MSNPSKANDHAPEKITPDGFQTPIEPSQRKAVDQTETDGRPTARSDAQPGSEITHQKAE